MPPITHKKRRFGIRRVANSLRQELVPDGLLGRVNSSYRLLAKGFGLAAPFRFAASVAVMTAVAWRTIGDGNVADARRGAGGSA